MVASFKDLQMTGHRPLVFVEHGAGQCYGPDHPSYPGGRGRDRVALFVCPSERVAGANLRRYPKARAVVAGCPSLDRLHMVAPPPGLAAAAAFHWNSSVCPETSTAWPYYREALAELVADQPIVGTGHPRIWGQLESWYRSAGIAPIARLEALARAADVLLVDNSSIAFEWMTLDRPVVFLNAPWYRREISHGGRFWTWADAGVQVNEPEQLAGAIEEARADPPERARRRHEVVEEIYAYRDGRAAMRAARAIEGVIG